MITLQEVEEGLQKATPPREIRHYSLSYRHVYEPARPPLEWVEKAKAARMAKETAHGRALEGPGRSSYPRG